MIDKIINFYKNLKSERKNKKRMSIRYQDTNANIPLFFYESQVSFEHHKN